MAAIPSSNGRGPSSSASAPAGFTLTVPMGVDRRSPGVCSAFPCCPRSWASPRACSLSQGPVWSSVSATLCPISNWTPCVVVVVDSLCVVLLNRQRSLHVLDTSPRLDVNRQLVLHPPRLMLAPPEEVTGDSVSADPASREAPECIQAPSRHRIKALGRLSPESPEFLGAAHFHLNFTPTPR